MLQAQLQHKVPREFEGMEDVLTSSTIGLLGYLPGALAAEVVAKLADIRIEDESVEVALWPSYVTPAGFRISGNLNDDPDEVHSARGRTEPDAVLSGRGWLVLVEAKYHSSLDEEYDQLGREFLVGLDKAKENGLSYRLLVVTAHTLEPRPTGVSLVDGVKVAVAKAQGDRAPETAGAVPASLRWTNWQRLYGILKHEAGNQDRERYTRSLLDDACKLLELHGLVPYDGEAIQETMWRWQGSGIPEEDWRSPLIYRSRTMASLKTGWGELMSLDASNLGALAWRPYTLTPPAKAQRPERDSVRLEDFDLATLQPIEWQPYQQKGSPS
jgi:hypothetical protein